MLLLLLGDTNLCQSLQNFLSCWGSPTRIIQIHVDCVGHAGATKYKYNGKQGHNESLNGAIEEHKNEVNIVNADAAYPPILEKSDIPIDIEKS